MYKYTYDNEPEPKEIETGEDRFLRKFKKIFSIVSTILAIIVLGMIIYSFVLHRP